MKVSKRLLSVLLCIAMVLSMTSSFTYALGGAASTEVVADNTQNAIETGTTTTDTEDVAPTVVGSSSSTFNPGPNPTTNVAAPTITNNTVVYDSSATDNTYTLSFTDKSTGNAVDASAWTANYGTNLFSDFASAAKAAGTNGEGVLLMLSDAEKKTITGLTNTLKIYTPYPH